MRNENAVEQLTPNPVTHEHGENGCGKTPWELESQGKAKPKTNGDNIRTMTDEELAEAACGMIICFWCPVKGCRGCAPDECKEALLAFLRSPAEDGDE